jgi:hypothetical protein
MWLVKQTNQNALRGGKLHANCSARISLQYGMEIKKILKTLNLQHFKQIPIYMFLTYIRKMKFLYVVLFCQYISVLFYNKISKYHPQKLRSLCYEDIFREMERIFAKDRD